MPSWQPGAPRTNPTGGKQLAVASGLPLVHGVPLDWLLGPQVHTRSNPMDDTNKTDSQGTETGKPSGVSRRRVIQGAAVGAVATAVAAGAKAAVGSASSAEAAVETGYTVPTGFTGTMADLKHVVILMQENRS